MTMCFPCALIVNRVPDGPSFVFLLFFFSETDVLRARIVVGAQIQGFTLHTAEISSALHTSTPTGNNCVCKVNHVTQRRLHGRHRCSNGSCST